MQQFISVKKWAGWYFEHLERGDFVSGVSIEALGLKYVFVCFQNYWGECLFFWLFLLGIFWTLARRKKGEAGIFCQYTVFLFLTAYNPLVVKYLVPLLGFENEYYRFIWILPVIPAIAYYAVCFIFHGKGNIKKVLKILAVFLVLGIAGVPLQGIAQNFNVIENIYKIPNDLRAVCAVIQEDSEKENPRVVFGDGLNNTARQYDPSLHLVLNRDVILYLAGSDVIGTFDETRPFFKRQKVIIEVVMQEKKMKKAIFQKVLKKTRTDYLVIPVARQNHDYIRECGCIPIAQTENYVVYRYDWEA